MKKEKKKITAMKILVSVFVVGVVTHSLHNMQKMQNAPYSKKSTSKKRSPPVRQNLKEQPIKRRIPCHSSQYPQS